MIKRFTSFMENIFEPLFTMAMPFLFLFSVLTLAAGTVFGVFLAATSISLYLGFATYSGLFKDDLKKMASEAEEIEQTGKKERKAKTEELNNNMTAIQNKKEEIKNRINELEERNKEIQGKISKLKNPGVHLTSHEPPKDEMSEENLVL